MENGVHNPTALFSVYPGGYELISPVRRCIIPRAQNTPV